MAPSQKKFAAMKPWRRSRPTQGCSTNVEEEEEVEEGSELLGFILWTVSIWSMVCKVMSPCIVACG
jgi:hypothetical protein